MKKNNFKYLTIIKVIIPVWLISVSLYSCNKFINTPAPSNTITSTAVFSTDEGITAALTGAYQILAQNATSASVEPTLFSDELTEPNAFGTDVQAQNNTYNNGVDFGYFINYYQVIYQANNIILSLDQSGALNDAVAKQAIGEAYFLRAYCYFKLTNFYGSVPLVNSTNVNVTALQGNTPVAAIYQSMVADLKKALSLVSTSYPSASRARVNSNVVSAMLSKVYLYDKDWADAESTASDVINSGNYGLEQNLNNVFLIGSNETIWQLYNPNGYTYIGAEFLPFNPSNLSFVVRTGLINAFETGDNRKTDWLQPGSGADSAAYYPYKYKQRSNNNGASAEYEVQLRLAEVYLIRAEARAEQNNVPGSLSDLNIIRNRAGLTNAQSASQSDLLLKVEQERRIELMFEEGNRWFDLNRTGRTVALLTPIKPAFKAYEELLPYPLTVIKANPNIIQNPGY